MQWKRNGVFESAIVFKEDRLRQHGDAGELIVGVVFVLLCSRLVTFFLRGSGSGRFNCWAELVNVVLQFWKPEVTSVLGVPFSSLFPVGRLKFSRFGDRLATSF